MIHKIIKPARIGFLGLFIVLSFACSREDPNQEITSITVINQTEIPDLYAVSAFKNKCRAKNVLVESAAGAGQGLSVIIRDYEMLDDMQNPGEESYRIRYAKNNTLEVFTSDQRGLIYALQSVYENLFLLDGTVDKIDFTQKPAFPFRTIKFNLPWNSYREHETLQLHSEILRDLGFWERFLDMMSRNRFNTLTLWSVHPWTYMIRPEKYPEACPFNDEELADWQAYWHGLFGFAKERGIKVFMINWNIFVSPEFSKAHGVAEYSQHLDRGYNGYGDYSELVQQYNKDVVRQVLKEYPELSGIGVSQNERMKGENVTEEQWQQWIVDTYFDIVTEARPDGEFIIRGHTHPAPELTRAAIEDNAGRLPAKVWVPLKYNWSHGHARPELFYIHGGSDSDIWWNPLPDRYQVVFTIRNEDFFVLRWGSHSFIRELLEFNRSNPAVGGFIIGSETYIPAKDYITRPGNHLSWDYAFEKQWLFYKLWGRLMYNPGMDLGVVAASFDEKYGITDGERLLEAYDLASQMPLKLASYYGATWDFTLYSEGFFSGFRPWRGEHWDNHSPFLSVEDIIGANPVDSTWVNIAEYVDLSIRKKITDGNIHTPVAMAGELERTATKALELVKSMEYADPTLMHEIADIRAWSNLSLYFVAKIRGSVEFEFYRRQNDPERKKNAVDHLKEALSYWDKVIHITDPYFEEIPMLHFGDPYIMENFTVPIERFSWENLRDQVERDIEYVENH